MKRIIAFLIFMAAFMGWSNLGGVWAFGEQESTPYHVDVMAWKTQLKGGTNVRVSVRSNAAEAMDNVMILVAVYEEDGGPMRALESAAVSVDAGKTRDVTLFLPGEAAYDLYRIHVWSNLDDMQSLGPICTAAEASAVDIPLMEEGKGERFRGLVTQNEVFTLEQEEILPEKDSVTIKITNHFGAADCAYRVGTSYCFGTGDTDAFRYVGRAVEFFVYSGTITSMMLLPDEYSNETTETFYLNQFVSVEGDYLQYKKLSANAETVQLKLQEGCRVIGNGKEYMGNTLDILRSVSNMIQSSNALSGKITALDRDGNDGYELMFIEIAVTAIVQSVDAGTVVFEKETICPRFSSGGGVKRVRSVNCGDSNITCLIAEHGKKVLWSDLQKGDVLCCVFNEDATVFDMQRLSPIEAKVVSSRASDTSACSQCVALFYGGNSDWYDVADYSGVSEVPRVGSEGEFFIDDYGKLVAYKNIAFQELTEGYGYILNAGPESNDAEAMGIMVQILGQDGQIYEKNTASKVKVENLRQRLTEEAGVSGTDDLYDIASIGSETGGYRKLQYIAQALINQPVFYHADLDGDLDLLGLSGTEGSQLRYVETQNAKKMTYDGAAMKFDHYGIDSAAKVFFIQGDGDNPISGPGDIATRPCPDSCFVGDKTSIAGGAYSVALYNLSAETEGAEVVVMFNTSGGIVPDTSIAVIESVAVSGVGDAERYRVTFHMDGRICHAVAAPGASGELKNSSRGDIFKLKLIDGVIRQAEPWLMFQQHEAGDSDSLRMREAQNGYPVVKRLKVLEEQDEQVDFGAVVDKRASYNTIFLVPWNEKQQTYAIDTDEQTTYRIPSDARIYVYDPEANTISLGKLSDLEVDRELIQEGKQVYESLHAPSPMAKTPALGMLDYMFIGDFDYAPVEVVIYKAYDFGRYIVK